jgi:cytochrome P450
MTLKCPVETEELQYPFQKDPARPLEPAPVVHRLRHDQPVAKVSLWDGKESWIFTRFEDVRAVLGDLRFSAVPTHENYPMLSPGVAASKIQDTSFIRKDPPVHTQHRMLWQAFFAPKHIASIRPQIQAYVDRAIDEMIASGSPADFVKHVALPVPSSVIASLLGVPDEDHVFFHAYGVIRGGINPTPEQVTETMTSMRAYWSRRIDERLEVPGDDLVSHLITNQVKTGAITKDDLIAMCLLMIVAGHDTTAKMLGLSVRTLLQNPELLDRIKQDPTRTPAAVEELMRYLSINQNGLQRVALEDVEIGGVTIPKGDGVIVHLPSANWDEAEFDHPERLDIDRAVKKHVGFGAGFHLCIGAPLARAELQIAIDTLFRRLPNLRLAVPDSEVSYAFDALFYGVNKLPVAW